MGMNPDRVVAEGLVGSQSRGDGAYGQQRLSKTGALVVTEAHGGLFEASSRGKLFIASIGVAGVAPGTALSTTPALQLYNPTNSGVLLSIIRVVVGYVSGTLGAGMLVHAQNSSQVSAPTGGTELTPVIANLSGARGAAKAFTGSTLSAASTLIRPSISMGAALATSVAFPSVVVDEIIGGIVVPSGVVWCYQGIAAAGTSPLLCFSVVYEEIPVP